MVYFADQYLDLAIPRLPASLPYEVRVNWYYHAFQEADTPSRRDLEIAWQRTGDHADYPASSCRNDCDARHAALTELLYPTAHKGSCNG